MVLALAGGTVPAHQPDLGARQVLRIGHRPQQAADPFPQGPASADAGGTGPSAIRTRTAANPARSGPFVPRRQERVRNAASGIAANSSATPPLLAEGTGCFLGRPFGFGAGQLSVTSAG